MSFTGLCGLALLASGCSDSSELPDTSEPECGTGLRMLAAANPVRDAEQALGGGSREIIGVYGYSTEYPGVPDGWQHWGSYSVRMVEGTSDFITSKECERFNAAARTYARDYNAVMVKAAR